MSFLKKFPHFDKTGIYKGVTQHTYIKEIYGNRESNSFAIMNKRHHRYLTLYITLRDL